MNDKIVTLDNLEYFYNKFQDENGVFIGSIGNKQDKLESGTNIKTINGESILGSGDITINGGVSEDYVNTAIANAITTTLNIAV